MRKSKRSLFDEIIEAERLDGRRMLLDEHDWTVFVPYFAQFPFEMMLVPQRRYGDACGSDRCGT